MYARIRKLHLKQVCITLRQSVLSLSIPLWAAVHINVVLIPGRTKFCVTSTDVDVLLLWSPDMMATVQICFATQTIFDDNKNNARTSMSVL